MMDIDMTVPELSNNTKNSEVLYSKEKDFYRGIGGELRMKAEGLFKKAKEKGISIEDISIITLKENTAEFPGIGTMELPTYVVKVVGKDITNGQVMVDAKKIDYYNIYQESLANKIEKKNSLRDEKGRVVKENNKPKLKQDIEFILSDGERFEIGKNIIEDKEFGLEKTITGACDRVIRKLMGENDWLYPEEAKQLEDEFNKVQNKTVIEQHEANKQGMTEAPVRKATDRQISYLKARIKNAGMDPEDEKVIKEVLRQLGYAEHVTTLSTSDMSKIIESFNSVALKVKESMEKPAVITGIKKSDFPGLNEGIRQ